MSKKKQTNDVIWSSSLDGVISENQMLLQMVCGWVCSPQNSGQHILSLEVRDSQGELCSVQTVTVVPLLKFNSLDLWTPVFFNRK